MGEGREYVSRSDELGNIHISEEVLAVIAAAAALEVEGVGGLAANLGTDLAELLGKKNLSRGIRLQVEEENVTVEVAILVSMATPFRMWATPCRKLWLAASRPPAVSLSPPST